VFGDEDVEVTTFRQDKDYPAGSRRPEVEFSTVLLDDLVRRDFTINTMAFRWNPNPGRSHVTLEHEGWAEDVWTTDSRLELVDLFGGMNDLFNDCVLRSPQEAVKLMTDDPLRILRAYRFAHRFGLHFDDDLRAAVRQCATRLAVVSRERIQVELMKIAGGNQPEEAFREMMEDGVLQQFIPELANQVGWDQQNPHHHLPLWEHTLSVVFHTKANGGNARAVLTALLHDVAKPVQFQRVYKCNTCWVPFPDKCLIRVNHGKRPVEERTCMCGHGLGVAFGSAVMTFEKLQFLGHDFVGAQMCREILTRLKFSTEDVEAVAKMVDLHQHDYRESHKPKTVRRFANELGELAAEFIAFLKGDRLGHAPGAFSTTDYLEVLEENLKTVNVSEMVNPKLPIDGHFVMKQLGLRQGRELGTLMKALKEAFIDGTVVTPEEALAFVWGVHNEGANCT
jgi:poly(A) polymerase